MATARHVHRPPADLESPASPPILLRHRTGAGVQTAQALVEKDSPGFPGPPPTARSQVATGEFSGHDFSQVPVHTDYRAVGGNPVVGRERTSVGTLGTRLEVPAPDSLLERQAATIARTRAGPGAQSGLCASAPAAGFSPVTASSGRPLDPMVRQGFERTLGADLSEVRVHDDQAAHDFTVGAAAKAATVGSRIYFGKDRFAPGTAAGQELLRHELVHTLQPGSGLVLHRAPESGALPAEAEPVRIRIGQVVSIKGPPNTGNESFDWLVKHIPAGYHLNPAVNARNFRNFYQPGSGPNGEGGIWVIMEPNRTGRRKGGHGSGAATGGPPLEAAPDSSGKGAQTKAVVAAESAATTGRPAAQAEGGGSKEGTDAATGRSPAAGQDHAAPGSGSREAPGRTSGQGAVTTWDSIHRGSYVNENKARSAKAVEAVEQAGRENNPGKAIEIAKQVSEDRAAGRTAFQEKVSPGARDLSKAIDTGQDFSASVEKYSKRLPSVEGGAAVPAESETELARRIAVGAGETRTSIKALARFGRIAGPVAVALGIGLAIRAVVNAPPGQRGRVAAREVGAFLGGLVGLSIGTSAGVAAAGFLAALIVALGFSNPIGWLAIGLGLVAGGLVGWWFSKRGGQLGEAVYDAADQ